MPFLWNAYYTDLRLWVKVLHPWDYKAMFVNFVPSSQEEESVCLIDHKPNSVHYIYVVIFFWIWPVTLYWRNSIMTWTWSLVFNFLSLRRLWWPSLSYWRRFFVATWQAFHGWIFLLHLRYHIWWNVVYQNFLVFVLEDEYSHGPRVEWKPRSNHP